MARIAGHFFLYIKRCVYYLFVNKTATWYLNAYFNLFEDFGD